MIIIIASFVICMVMHLIMHILTKVASDISENSYSYNLGGKVAWATLMIVVSFLMVWMGTYAVHSAIIYLFF